VPHLAYRFPLAREVDCFAFNFLLLVPTRNFALERFEVLAVNVELATKRFEVFAVDGELMIKRTELIRFALKPSL
jgi:hypothetical protein